MLAAWMALLPELTVLAAAVPLFRSAILCSPWLLAPLLASSVFVKGGPLFRSAAWPLAPLSRVNCSLRRPGRWLRFRHPLLWEQPVSWEKPAPRRPGRWLRFRHPLAWEQPASESLATRSTSLIHCHEDSRLWPLAPLSPRPFP
ncbi:MAG: hypothetical protein BJ554DRAFT_5361 [Olpidium bornovanus]|uniref:Secreted protein n=1 Tax=Olpidium bornovanus TaxID=278681 RepID=A0A8H7ZZL6_9FUNG|nr:MAG: hypothetical protein BJ554DRAFT_5361 [Olpidium bornovanus]